MYSRLFSYRERGVLRWVGRAHRDNYRQQPYEDIRPRIPYYTALHMHGAGGGGGGAAPGGRPRGAPGGGPRARADENERARCAESARAGGFSFLTNLYTSPPSSATLDPSYGHA